jgi:hypothetical protein
MKVVSWMAAASAISWLGVVWLTGAEVGTDVLWGMMGPLAATSGSWVLAERAYKRHPESLTSLMAAGFAAKLVFFGVYVAVMLRVPLVRPVPFVVSFTGYFIALYVTEAFCLRRLFAGPARESR